MYIGCYLEKALSIHDLNREYGTNIYIIITYIQHIMTIINNNNFALFHKFSLCAARTYIPQTYLNINLFDHHNVGNTWITIHPSIHDTFDHP
jgi:hypothetical protein